MDTATYLEDLLSSIENLPKEVQHILGEILERDTEQWQLKGIIKDARIRIHSMVTKGNGEAPGAEELALIQQIQQAFKQLDSLSDDKVALAERTLGLMDKTLKRIEIDLRKLSFDLEIPIEQFGISSSPPATNKTHRTSSTKHKRHSSTTKSAIFKTSPNSSPPRRKLYDNANDAIVLDLMASSTEKNSGKAVHERSSSSEYTPSPPKEKHRRRHHSSATKDSPRGTPSLDNNSDEGLYCNCHQPSYGAMVACDAPNCPIEWFHLGCVGLSQLPPQGAKWYCKDCLAKAKAMHVPPETFYKSSLSHKKRHNL